MVMLDDDEYPSVAFSAGLPGGISISQLSDLRSVREAMAAPDAEGWRNAMDKEMDNIQSHDVYELNPRTSGKRTLRLGWVFNRKFKNGVFEKNKARLVTRGNQQSPGIDYLKSFSTVMHLDSLRTLLALAAIPRLRHRTVQHHVSVSSWEARGDYIYGATRWIHSTRYIPYIGDGGGYFDQDLT